MPRWIAMLLAAGLLGAALLAGCGGGNGGGNPTTQPGSRDPQSPNFTPPESDPTLPPRTATATSAVATTAGPPTGAVRDRTAQELLDLSTQASQFITSLRYHSTVGPDGAGNYIASTVEVVPPDRMRERQEFGEQTRTIVQVGPAAYLREGSGPWGPLEGVPPFAFPPQSEEQMPVYVPVILGYEEIDGSECAIVSFEQQASIQEQRFVEFVQWICEDDFLVRKSEVYAVQEGERALRAVSEDFEYNIPIEAIELPQ
jgi:hypothetical protein